MTLSRAKNNSNTVLEKETFLFVLRINLRRGIIFLFVREARFEVLLVSAFVYNFR